MDKDKVVLEDLTLFLNTETVLRLLNGLVVEVREGTRQGVLVQVDGIKTEVGRDDFGKRAGMMTVFFQFVLTLEPDRTVNIKSLVR